MVRFKRKGKYKSACTCLRFLWRKHFCQSAQRWGRRPALCLTFERAEPGWVSYLGWPLPGVTHTLRDLTLVWGCRHILKIFRNSRGWSWCHCVIFWPADSSLPQQSCWSGPSAPGEPLDLAAHWPSVCPSAGGGWWPQSCAAERLSASPCWSEACQLAKPGVWCSGSSRRGWAGLEDSWRSAPGCSLGPVWRCTSHLWQTWWTVWTLSGGSFAGLSRREPGGRSPGTHSGRGWRRLCGWVACEWPDRRRSSAPGSHSIAAGHRPPRRTWLLLNTNIHGKTRGMHLI